ncbi:MAG TPA: helix-turn-helix transcriptional regulator [Pirellulales bacterium]|nr:helix-turn-helix transcriptional regulator [Pirellulales bacterium]
MATNAFGSLLKKLRLASGVTMREFCLRHGLDPGNYSRLERGLFPAPQKEELLTKYAEALGLKRGSDEWLEFFDVAAASRGELPRDLLGDEELVGKLPALFRTIRGKPVSAEQLDALIDRIRES